MNAIDTDIQITTQADMSAGKISAHLWLSFAVCFFSNVFAGLISTLMSVYLPVVVTDLSGSTGDLPRISGTISALYIAGWTVGGFTWGFISDRIGRTKALALSIGTFGLFTLMISFASTWEFVVAFRLLSGFSVGGILVLTPTLLSEIWPARSRSVMIGIDSIGFPVGIFSSGLVTVLVNDWRGAFFVGIPPMIIALLSIWVLKESDNWRASRTGKKSIAGPGARADLLKGAIIFGSMLIGLWGMFSWIPTWVQSLLTGSDGQSERGVTMMLLGGGGLLGGFISGWVSDSLGVRKAMLVCFSGCIVMSFLLFGLNNSFHVIIYPELALLSLFFGISQGLLSIYIPQLFPYHIRGTYTGICFNIGRIFTTVAIFFVGVLVTSFGGYGNTLLAFAGIFVLGFIAVYFAGDKTKSLTARPALDAGESTEAGKV
ncbi:MAG TPA: MFS transporter [Cyclobacteriaceae bacterium]|nr:MFS transporter [Cyclobacteriaceae bacterium]